MKLSRTWINYPDDIGHPYALLRAWDRHLVEVGLLPISTSDLSKVGPILVNPNGSGLFYSYGRAGRLSLKILLRIDAG